MEDMVIHSGVLMPKAFVPAWDEMVMFAEYCKAHPIVDKESED